MLVCGQAPFNEANDSETLINIMDCRYKVLDHVSEECKDLIMRMIIRYKKSEPAFSKMSRVDKIFQIPFNLSIACLMCYMFHFQSSAVSVT